MKSTEAPIPKDLLSQEGAVLHDLSSGAWVVDVSDSSPDRELIRRDKDAVLVCFGAHAPSECALSAAPPVPHGVVFEVSPESVSAARYVERFTELVGVGHPITVNVRSPL